MRPIGLVRLALGFALVCGCAQKSSESSVTTTQGDTTGAAVRTQSESDFDQHLAATRAHIDSLREEASRAGSKASAAMAAKLSEVEAQRDTAEQRLARLRQATQDEWNQMEAGVANMLDSLDTRVDTLRSQLRRPGH